MHGGYLARGLVYRQGRQMDGMLINVPFIETDKTKRVLPEHRVIQESQEFLAALNPDEQEMRDFIVAQSPELLRVFRECFGPAGALGDNPFLERLRVNYAFSFDVDALPEPFPAPSLILCGRFDNWCGYREAYKILDNYPRATFAVLDKAGHALAVEQQTLFRALAKEWLERVEEYAIQSAN